MYKFSLEKPKKKVNIINVELRYFIFQSVIKKRFAKNLFSTNFAPPKAVAPQGHGLIGLRHKVALSPDLAGWQHTMGWRPPAPEIGDRWRPSTNWLPSTPDLISPPTIKSNGGIRKG